LLTLEGTEVFEGFGYLFRKVREQVILVAFVTNGDFSGRDNPYFSPLDADLLSLKLKRNVVIRQGDKTQSRPGGPLQYNTGSEASVRSGGVYVQVATVVG
jgi:hypothetical protein